MSIIRTADGSVPVADGCAPVCIGHRPSMAWRGVLGLASRIASSPQLAGAVIGTTVSACFGFLAWETREHFSSSPYYSYRLLTERSYEKIWLNFGVVTQSMFRS